jgi:hypothetical protein
LRKYNILEEKQKFCCCGPVLLKFDSVFEKINIIKYSRCFALFVIMSENLKKAPSTAYFLKT